MNPGDFNRRISFQKNITGTDDDGYPIEELQIVKTIWAKVLPVSSKEFFENNRTQSENITRFIVRYRKDVTKDMVILYDGRRYEITSILDDGDGRVTLTIMGKELE